MIAEAPLDRRRGLHHGLEPWHVAARHLPPPAFADVAADQQEQAELAAIRAEHTRDLAAIEAEKKLLAGMEQERDQCRAEKLECSVDRDALKVLARNMLAAGTRSPVPAAPPPGALDPRPPEPAPSGAPASTAVQAPTPPPPAALPPAAPPASPPPAPGAPAQTAGS